MSDIEITIEEQRTVTISWGAVNSESEEWTEQDWTSNFAIIAMAQFKTLEKLRDERIRVSGFDLMWSEGIACAFIDIEQVEQVEQALRLAYEAVSGAVAEYDQLTR